MEDATRKKRKRERSPTPHHIFFPLLISSLYNSRLLYARRITGRLLRSHLALVRSGNRGPSIPPGFIALLPLLLCQKKQNHAVIVLAAEIIGAVALYSIESSEEIASDIATVRMLVADLGSKSKKVAIAACHAVLDLSAASFCREQLRKSLAVEKLLWASAGRAGIGLALPFLDAAMILINSCDHYNFLENIPGETTSKFLPLARKFRINCTDKNRSSELAETIFRLSIDKDSFSSYPHDLLRIMIFGKEELAFEKFILLHWENSPTILKSRSEDNFFSSLFNFASGSLDAILESIIKGFVSCPPLASDELDIFSFLEEVSESLGSDLVSGQDFRLVRTLVLGSVSKEEVKILDSDALTVKQIVSTCEEAVRDGYTLAIRGLEFRLKEVAGISDSLASVFGQPSVGVNAYLTPPMSQGLSRHFDDHCVFICQLCGVKRWVVSPRSTSLLPRLYEDSGASSAEETGSHCGAAREFVLQQGDILYIPRGCLHEASTTDNGGEDQLQISSFSLHLTIAIEVEPPFEWEGFVHIALHQWSQNQTQNHPRLVINLFHIAISLAGNQNPIFHKACLLLSNAHHSTIQISKNTFTNVISSVKALTSFSEAIDKTKLALVEDDSIFFLRLCWLRHLPSGSFDFDEHLKAFEKLLPLSEDQIVDLESEFAEIKDQFCRSVDFEDSKRGLEVMHRKYKKVRKQYMNGMLSLNSMI